MHALVIVVGRAGIDLEGVNSIHKTKSGRWLSILPSNVF